MTRSLLNLFFSLLLLVLPFGQLFRFQLTPSLSFFPHDILITAIFLLWLIFYLPRRQFSLPPGTSFILGFLGLALISLFLNWNPTSNLFAFLYWLRFAIQIGFFLALYSLFKHQELNLPLFRFLTFAFSLSLILGLSQFVFLPDTRFLNEFGWDDHLNRLIGTFFDPAFTGLFFLFGFFITLTTSVTFSVLFLIGLVLTFSRATYLTFALALSFFAFASRRLRLLVLLLFFFLLIYLLPSSEGEGVRLDRTYSLTTRTQTTISGFDHFTNSPLLGIGFNHYPKPDNLPLNHSYHPSAPDNSYIFILATTGIIGFGLFLAWQAKIFVHGIKKSPVLATLTLAFSFHALANNTLFYSFLLLTYLIIAAYLLASKPSP